ncbi:farnesyl-diphosphate synthase [Clostridium carboxidivorans P7]|uniref:Farnesyl diphosphate synthase n=1 Tax=Clostridium carboxidivorans P7 TaxID=536227 RepID=C6PQR2_9CLOT|nr:farnesyl diphosphate synthase [Clostridium carboxidivorans]AKN34031.1 farnesyl-diphosphate synthase [Clostridium carboxidivorans P7]EET88434.1 Polyprenyl synthetase [Clostridium carboxidivorans P7]EFG88096.1 putative geranyltranstransferase [Clostridium carboxidivorans P7]
MEKEISIEHLRNSIENWLGSYFKDKGSYNKKVYEAMEYSLGAGGKRIRPLLLLLTYMLYKDDFEKVLPIASAVEMIHTYSLIHDDLPCMDNDDLRRGKPTNHKVFGEAVAVLAGDGLLNEGMSIMLKSCMNEQHNFIKACSFIAESAGAEGMVGGQTVDILSENTKIPIDQLYYMHSKKTGAIIKASIIAGAILGEAPKRDIENLEYYGQKLGLAFQIKDDILDIVGDTEVLGKKAKSDLDNNKTTFITTYGLNKCIEMCNSITAECIEVLDNISGDTSKLKDLTLFLLNREK